MNYYQVLGLSEGADPKEIKRAYFKLVRQYSPEKDPERFQQIREAYEHLTEDSSKEKEGIIALEFPDTLLASQMREQIKKRMDVHDYKGAMMTAEEGLHYFGEFEGFLYFLAICQRHVGKTGKSVKNFERLVQLFPDKLMYRKELAYAYLERGFMNKAYQAFQTAYSKGIRDLNFLHMFSLCCKDRYMDEQAVSLLLELIALAEKKPKENLQLLIDSYGGVFCLREAVSDSELRTAQENFVKFLHSAAPYLPEYEEELLYLLQVMITSTSMYGTDNDLFKTILQEIKGICSVNRGKKNDPYENVWKGFDVFLEYSAFDSDSRIPQWLKNCFSDLMEHHDDPQLTRFIRRDIQLCILEEWPAIKEPLHIIRQSCPLLYEELQDFVRTMEQTQNVDSLRDRLLKDYDRLLLNFNGGLYYEKYPERQRRQPVTQWDSDTDGTYVRSQPKIGRNDPCPCGSGKKYKNCCGRK